jgi:hypothetical protein
VKLLLLLVDACGYIGGVLWGFGNRGSEMGDWKWGFGNGGFEILSVGP